MNLDQTYPAALGVEIVHGLFHRLGGGTHDHNDFFRVRSAVVVEELIVPARQLVELLHIVLHRVGDGGDSLVGALFALKIDVGVDVVAPVGGMLRVQGLTAEGLNGVLVHQRPQVRVVQHLNALHLVGRAEAVEAVHKGVLSPYGAEMRHRRQVHGLLGRGGHQHGIAGHAAGHEIRVVPEDGVVVAGHHPGSNVHDMGEKLASHGIHGRDHQHQALRGGEGGGQGSGLGCAVTGSRRTGFGLHLNHIHRGAEEIFPPLGRPFVHVLRHGRGRCNGVDGRHFRKGVGGVCRCRVAVHDSVMLVSHC